MLSFCFVTLFLASLLLLFLHLNFLIFLYLFWLFLFLRNQCLLHFLFFIIFFFFLILRTSSSFNWIFSSTKHHCNAFLLAESFGLRYISVGKHISYNAADSDPNIYNYFSHLTVSHLWEPGSCHIIKAPACKHTK